MRRLSRGKKAHGPLIGSIELSDSSHWRSTCAIRTPKQLSFQLHPFPSLEAGMLNIDSRQRKITLPFSCTEFQVESNRQSLLATYHLLGEGGALQRVKLVDPRRLGISF